MELDVAVHLRTLGWKTALRPYCKTTQEACLAALEETRLGRGKAVWEMTVVLADDAFIRSLNRDYRGKDKPTNVLSFPSGEPLGRKGGYLGDVVLALQTVEKEAAQQGKSFKHHATHLIAHGALHLIGYDHEKDKEATRMERLEVKILNKLGIANPYL